MLSIWGEALLSVLATKRQVSGKNVVNRLATVEWWKRAPLMSEWRSDGADHQL